MEGVWVYLLIGAIGLIFNLLKENNKKKSTPKPTSFKDILKELQKKIEESAPQIPAPVPTPSPVYERPVYENISSEVASLEDIEDETTTTHRMVAVTTPKEDAKPALRTENYDWRQGILVSEILKRPDY